MMTIILLYKGSQDSGTSDYIFLVLGPTDPHWKAYFKDPVKTNIQVFQLNTQNDSASNIPNYSDFFMVIVRLCDSIVSKAPRHSLSFTSVHSY